MIIAQRLLPVSHQKVTSSDLLAVFLNPDIISPAIVKHTNALSTRQSKSKKIRLRKVTLDCRCKRLRFPLSRPKIADRLPSGALMPIAFADTMRPDPRRRPGIDRRPAPRDARGANDGERPRGTDSGYPCLPGAADSDQAGIPGGAPDHLARLQSALATFSEPPKPDVLAQHVMTRQVDTDRTLRDQLTRANQYIIHWVVSQNHTRLLPMSRASWMLGAVEDIATLGVRRTRELPRHQLSASRLN